MSFNASLSDKMLQISHQHLATALNQALLGFWEVDLSGERSMVCTDQCKRNFGRAVTQDFSYSEMLEAVIAEDQEQMQEAIKLAIEEQVVYFSQYRVKHPDGKVRWIEAQGMVIWKSDVPEKMIGTTIDITKIKDLEILRDELLSFAMHELKSPLSVVKGSLQILERYVKSQNDQKIIAIASRALGSTERISRLLNELAHPINAQSTTMVLQRTAFDVSHLASEIAENVALVSPHAKIQVSSNEDAVIVFADRFRIGQVISNVVNNAIKYSPEQPIIHIHISSSHSATTVKISDKGMGILPDDWAKVFQKFYRSNENCSVEGLGIGLFLCSEIIVRHGGVIGIEDKDMPGTTVYFMLPS